VRQLAAAFADVAMHTVHWTQSGSKLPHSTEIQRASPPVTEWLQTVRMRSLRLTSTDCPEFTKRAVL
jgi:hypothetical protein